MTTIKTEILKDVLRIHLVIQLFLLYYSSWLLSLSVILGGIISSLNFYFMATQCERMLLVEAAGERRRLAVLSSFVRYGIMIFVVMLVSLSGLVVFEGFLPALLSVQLVIFIRAFAGRQDTKTAENREQV